MPDSAGPLLGLLLAAPWLVWSTYRLLRMLVSWWRRRRWEPVPATIIGVEFREGSYEGTLPQQDRTIVTYRYRAFTEYYRGRAPYHRDMPPVEGDQIRVHVDPRQHDRSILDTEDSRLWRAVTLLVVMAASSTMLLLAVANWQ